MKKKGERLHVMECIHRPDSVEVTRNAKGDYSWKIKVYYDSNEGKGKHDQVLKKLKQIDADLKKKFKS